MKRLSFLEKTKELLLYTDRYETVSLFELSQLYGSSLTAFLAFVLSLPMLVFSPLWLALPLTFGIICLSILLLFNEGLWLFDALKNIEIPSPFLRKATGYMVCALEALTARTPKLDFYDEQFSRFRMINACIIIVTAFQIGFLQAPNTSYLSILSLVVVSFAAFVDLGYIALGAYFIALLAFLA